MADFLEDQRRMIADRLNDLKPLVDEYARLEAAAAALAARAALPRRSRVKRRRANRPGRKRRRKPGRHAVLDGVGAAVNVLPKPSEPFSSSPASRSPRSPQRSGSSRTTYIASSRAS